MVKIVSDELITQINDQLKTVVKDSVKEEIRNIDWHGELDIYSLVQDELNKMVTQDYTIAEFRALILPKLPAEKRPRASDKIKTRDGKFPRTPAVGGIYPDSDTGRLYEYNGGEPDEITSYTDVTGQYTG